MTTTRSRTPTWTSAPCDAMNPTRHSLVTLLALTIAAAPVAAAPPVTDMHAASLTFAEAEQKLGAGDPDAAIALFEQGLGLIPDEPGYAPTRAQVLLTIVDAHESAFAGDGDIERLRRAKRLLDRYLGPLRLLDEQGRAAAEERRVNLINAIHAVEDKLRAEQAARAALDRRARAETARRQGRSFSAAGAALTGLGVAGLAIMGAGLGLGRAADARIDALKADKLASGDDWSLPCIDDACASMRRSELEPLLSRGNTSNVLAIVGAVAGGSLLTTGVTLWVLGRKKKREARSLEITPSPALTPTSLGLTLQGRF